MAAFNIEKFFQRIDSAATPADIDAAFSEITGLKPAARSRAINAVEKTVVSEFRDAFNDVSLAELRAKVELAGLVKNSLIGDLLEAAGFADEAPAEEVLVPQMAAQVVLNISNIKGDKADPLVKIFTAEAAKLSDAEYNSEYGQAKLLLRVIEKSQAAAAPAAPKPAPNPFRK